MRAGILILLITTAMQAVVAFPSGAPFDTCLAMYPKHSNLEKQQIPPPYNITLSPLTYKPGQNVTLTVTAHAGHMIRGIQTNARRAEVNRHEIIGTFVDWPDDKVQPLNCFLAQHNMITHRNNRDVEQIELVWKAPDKNVGPVFFTVTLLETYTVFWHGLSSPILEPEDPSSVVPPPVQADTVNTTFMPIDWKECGKTKGCLLYPRHCTGPDCYAAVTFTRGPNGYTFEMVGQGEGYVSVGFSHDKKMGDDQTVSCTAQGDRVTVQNGYNHKGLWNEWQMGLDLRDLQTRQEDGKIYCRFTRPEVTNVVYLSSKYDPFEVIPFDLQIDFYVFIAWGYTYQDTDVMKIHKEMPVISEEKINFRHFAVYRGSVMTEEKKIHASLMVVAWMVFAGLTTVLSRHFRDGDGATYVCGVKLWLQLHRFCAIMVFLVTGGGLAAILYYLKGEITMRKEAYSHACVGFTVVALVCAQVVSGLLRPTANSRFRVVYNYVHMFMGKASQIFSAAALFLAFRWDWESRVMREFGITVLVSWVAVQIVAEILLEIRRCCFAKRTEAVDINLDNDPVEKQEIRHNPSSLPILLYLLVPLAAGSAGLCMILLF